jgi:hypothetical protein
MFSSVVYGNDLVILALDEHGQMWKNVSSHQINGCDGWSKIPLLPTEEELFTLDKRKSSSKFQ